MSQSDALFAVADELINAEQLGSALTYTLSEIEQERSTLVRDLHDELGGLLVGALMDLSWISQQGGNPQGSKEKLARASSLLRSAIELKRELIEQLKPTLLENIGLYSAIRWHLKQQCDAAAVGYSESYPDEEIAIDARLKVEIFRIVEDALKYEFSAGTLSELTLSVRSPEGALHCSLEGRHSSSSVDDAATSDNAARIARMRFRAKALGGVFAMRAKPACHNLELHVPLLKYA